MQDCSHYHFMFYENISTIIFIVCNRYKLHYFMWGLQPSLFYFLKNIAINIFYFVIIIRITLLCGIIAIVILCFDWNFDVIILYFLAVSLSNLILIGQFLLILSQFWFEQTPTTSHVSSLRKLRCHERQIRSRPTVLLANFIATI